MNIRKLVERPSLLIKYVHGIIYKSVSLLIRVIIEMCKFEKTISRQVGIATI